MNKHILTDRAVRALKPGEWITDITARGAPCLQGRKLTDGKISWYLRYSTSERKQIRIPLGVGLSLADARAEAESVKRKAESLKPQYPDLAMRNDLREILRADIEARAEIARREEELRISRENATFGKLLDAYVEDLKRRSKIRWKDTENSLRRNVKIPWPKLISKPAIDITLHDLLDIVRQVVDSGRIREAAKVRTYLRAAYSAAVQAGQRADATPALADLKIMVNPARDLATIHGANTPRERVLTLAELQAYWKHIARIPLLQFHLLTGGQRIDQLRRLTTNDIDYDTQTITFRDPKGRRELPRIHVIPLLTEAMDALKALYGGQRGTYLWTLDAGEHAATYGAARDMLAKINRKMAESNEISSPFTLGDLRRTVETRLAAAGISMDIRAQLQSHGLSGVQIRHYDKHSYLQEKQHALETLRRLLG